MVAPDEALERLLDGNRRFMAGESIHNTESRGHRPNLSSGQQPFAIVLACSDSRVPVELVFDQGFGDLFVIRVAGNVVAPSQIGSIEYAAEVLGSRLVIVLGHSGCGAVSAAFDELKKDVDVRSPNLRSIVDRVRPAIEHTQTLEDAIRANVARSVERLRHGSRIVEQLVDDGELVIVGAEYSLEDGAVRLL